MIAIVCIVILYRFERSWLGLMWSSINENDQLARSSGVDVKTAQAVADRGDLLLHGRSGWLLRPLRGHSHPFWRPGRSLLVHGLSLPHHLHDGGGRSATSPVPSSAPIFSPSCRSWGVRSQQYIPLFMGAILLLVVFVFPEGIVGLVSQGHQGAAGAPRPAARRLPPRWRSMNRAANMSEFGMSEHEPSVRPPHGERDQAVRRPDRHRRCQPRPSTRAR